MPVPELLEAKEQGIEEYHAIGIYQFALGKRDRGEPMFGLDVDYSWLPLHFQRYRKDDQGRIAVRMVAQLNAARAGIDLETGPFPVKAMTLEAALAEIEAWRTEPT